MKCAAGGDKGKLAARRLIRFCHLAPLRRIRLPLLQKKLCRVFPGVSAASVFAGIARKGSSNSAVEVVLS